MSDDHIMDEWRTIAVRDLPAQPLNEQTAALLAKIMDPEVVVRRRKRLAAARRKGTEGAYRELGSHTW